MWVLHSLARRFVAPRKATPCLLARFRDFERPEHAPRSPAGTHTCTVVYRRPPCVPRSRERKKRPAVCVYVLVRPFIMQVFSGSKIDPFCPFCDFIFEVPSCTSVKFYASTLGKNKHFIFFVCTWYDTSAVIYGLEHTACRPRSFQVAAVGTMILNIRVAPHTHTNTPIAKQHLF